MVLSPALATTHPVLPEMKGPRAAPGPLSSWAAWRGRGRLGSRTRLHTQQHPCSQTGTGKLGVWDTHAHICTHTHAHACNCTPPSCHPTPPNTGPSTEPYPPHTHPHACFSSQALIAAHTPQCPQALGCMGGHVVQALVGRPGGKGRPPLYAATQRRPPCHLLPAPCPGGLKGTGTLFPPPLPHQAAGGGHCSHGGGEARSCPPPITEEAVRGTRCHTLSPKPARIQKREARG